MITFIHGLIGTPSNWYDVKLKTKLNTLTPEIDYMESTGEICKKIKSNLDTNKKNVCIGNSLGCYISMQMIHDFECVFLVAPPFQIQLKNNQFLSKKSLIENASSLITPDKQINRNANMCDWINNLRCKEKIKRLRQIKKELIGFNFTEKYRTHQNKIHFILGENDPLINSDEFLILARNNFPSATIDVIKNCGHAIPLEAPIQLSKIIKKYI